MTTPGSFCGPLRLEKVDNQRLWLLLEPLTYYPMAGEAITAQAGFLTDGASVPRLLWALYPPFGGEYDRAAVIHDLLYRFAEHFAGTDHGHISRGRADDLMLEMMQVDGFRPSGRRTVWSGVRVGGWVSWRRYRKAAQEQP